MVDSALKVPTNVSSQQAITLTQSLIEQVEANKLQPSEISAIVSDLVKNKDGARGFFAIYLTSALANNHSPEIVEALRSSPDAIAELLAKNVVMSAAQALYHRRNDNEEMAQSSERVCERNAILIKLVNLANVYETCQQLLESVTTGEGRFKRFLEEWGYDAEQKQLMAQALHLVLSS